MKSARMRLYGLVAAVMCLMATGNASAVTVTLDQAGINLISGGTVTFSSAGGSLQADCSFTLRGTLSTSIATTLNSLTSIGRITGVTGGPLFPCTGSMATGVSFGSFPYGVELAVQNTVLKQIVLNVLGVRPRFLGFCSSDWDLSPLRLSKGYNDGISPISINGAGLTASGSASFTNLCGSLAVSGSVDLSGIAPLGIRIIL
jgi:hypothetical protein